MTGTGTASEGLDFAELGRRLDMPPVAAVCAAVVHGYPLVNDRLPEHLLGALAHRCGVRLVEGPSPDAATRAVAAVVPADDPHQRRRILRTMLQRMIQRHNWLPSVADNHSIVRPLPTRERGLGREGIEVLVRAGWLRALKPSTNPALGMVIDARPAIEAAVDEARIDDPVILEWLQLPG